MEPALVDTNIVSMFLRGHTGVRDCVAGYLEEHGKLNLSIITVYEALSGLKHRDAKKQMASFRALVAASEVWPLTEQSVELSADMYAALRATGRTVDDIDLLIAGIAGSNGSRPTCFRPGEGSSAVRPVHDSPVAGSPS
jgi:tRNA(fMet)-specific endonuclease VapC